MIEIEAGVEGCDQRALGEDFEQTNACAAVDKFSNQLVARVLRGKKLFYKTAAAGKKVMSGGAVRGGRRVYKAAIGP